MLHYTRLHGYTDLHVYAPNAGVDCKQRLEVGGAFSVNTHDGRLGDEHPGPPWLAAHETLHTRNTGHRAEPPGQLTPSAQHRGRAEAAGSIQCSTSLNLIPITLWSVQQSRPAWCDALLNIYRKYTGHGHCSDDCAYTNARKRRHRKKPMQHTTMAGNIHYTLSNQATSGLMLITDPVSVSYRPSGSSITRQYGGVRTDTP